MLPEFKEGTVGAWRLDFQARTNAANASQCLGCGTLAPARIREQAANDKPVVAAISLSVKASSFGAISRLNHASSRCPGCSRDQLIAAMPLADRLASRPAHDGIAARIVAGGGLCYEGLACGLDRAESMLAAGLGHTRLAVPAPALEHRLAAHRARDR